VRRRLLWSIAFGALGFLVDGWPLVVFDELAFRFGGLFYLTATLALGPLWGLLAALLTGARHLTEGDVFPLLLMAGEAWTVGWVVRRGRSPLYADILYWALAGAPLLAFHSFLIRDLPWLSGAVLVTHRPVNGLLTVTLAELLLGIVPLSFLAPAMQGVGRRSMRRYLVHWFVLVAALPILVLGAVHARSNAQQRLAEATARLGEVGRELGREVDDFLDLQLRGMVSLARSIELSGGLDPGELDFRLERHHEIYPEISTLLVADRRGRLLATDPETPLGDDPRPILEIEQTVADREYFRRPLATGEPFVSNVFEGRGFSTDPVFAISAPVRLESGEVAAVVEGTLQIDAIGAGVEPVESLLAAGTVTIDRRRRVVVAGGGTPFRPLQSLAGSPILTTDAPGATYRYRAADGEELLAMRSRIGTSGWEVLVRLPLAEVRRETELGYLVTTAWTLTAILLAGLLARGLARRMTRPLEQLVELTRELREERFPERQPPLDSNAPLEVADLVRDFDDMSTRLQGSYRELRELAEKLDQRVRERTAELAAARRQTEKSEERYRDLVQGVDGIVWELDPERWRFTFVSHRAERILGYPIDRWLGTDDFLHRLIHPDDLERVRSRMRAAAEQEGRFELEHRAAAEDGTVRWLRNGGRLVMGREPEAPMLRGLMVDVTAHRAAQEELLQTRKLESIGTLAGGIAHDFNNLLTAILGNVSLLHQLVESDGELAPLLEQVSQAGQRARQLTQQLLTFSRGGLPVKKVTSLAALIEEFSAFALAGSNVRRELTLADDLWPVEVDEGQLGQVIQNLVLNAEQAMPDGGVVRIEAANLAVERGDGEAPDGEPPDADRWVRFRVIDEGVGIAPPDLSKIFDPYFTTKREGKGLGLATSYAIVDKHGGRVGVASEPGRGSTVTVDLPAADGAPESRAAEQPAAVGRGRGRVLVMDDEAPVREVAERMLEHLGYRVALTAEGREAVELYRREMDGSSSFDLVIVDLTVPGGMGGAEAVRRLRELDPSVRAVVCSGYSNDPVMARYREHGFVGVIHKPFDLGQLARVLAEAGSD